MLMIRGGGFSFRADGPLDLRFDQSRGETGTQLIASSSEDELVQVLLEYGELREAKRLACAMKGTLLQTTEQLRQVAETVLKWRTSKLLPQVFQALRIWVNDEIRALEHLLTVGPNMLKDGGRMGVISYHSLEDRLVKHTFRDLSTPPKDPVTGQDVHAALFRVLTKRPVQPKAVEQSQNPRSRSAKLRVLERRDSPPEENMSGF